jgi:predicted DNA-binding protein
MKSTFRLPTEMHQRLKIRAVQENRPIADLLIDAIELYLSKFGSADDDRVPGE